MSRLFLAASALLFMCLLALSDASAQTSKPAARKVDEFSDIQYSDLIARLDNFAIQLQNDPAAKGFILVYRSRRDLPGLNNRLALWSKAYMINSGGLSTRSLRKRTWAGDERAAEYLDAFATQLRKEPRSTACVIVYAQYNPRPGLVDYGNYEPVRDVRLDLPGTARKRLDSEKRRLISAYRIPAARIKTINGGYRKRRMVELWIVPRGEHAPIPTPNSFPPKRARSRK